MTYQYITYALAGPLATITLSQPKSLNAASLPMVDEINAALDDAARSARAVLITATGRGFCSGADLRPADRTEPLDMLADDYDAGITLDTHFNGLISRMRDFPVPLVAAVNGIAAGVGVSIALACDIILAAESASFLLAFRRIGLVPDGGATFMLLQSAGRAQAMEAMLLGEPIPSAKAMTWGLVNKVVPDAELHQAAVDVAMQLANGPTRALSLIRQLCWQAYDSSFIDMLKLERKAQFDAGKSADHREGISAFLEKRPAQFTGL